MEPTPSIIPFERWPVPSISSVPNFNIYYKYMELIGVFNLPSVLFGKPAVSRPTTATKSFLEYGQLSSRVCKFYDLAEAQQLKLVG